MLKVPGTDKTRFKVLDGSVLTLEGSGVLRYMIESLVELNDVDGLPTWGFLELGRYGR